jgi:hypothetical protein
MVSVLDAPAAVPVARGAFPEESVASFVNRIRTGDFGPEAGAYSFYPLGTRPGPRVERLAAAMQPIRTPLFMSGLSTDRGLRGGAPGARPPDRTHAPDSRSPQGPGPSPGG